MFTTFGTLFGKAKVLGLAGVATGAMALAPQVASAHDRFSFGLTIAAPAPVVVAAPVAVAPVYTPAPVVVTPAYVPAPVYATPAPVVVTPAPVVVTAPVCPAPVIVETPRYYHPRPLIVAGWHRDFGWGRR